MLIFDAVIKDNHTAENHDKKIVSIQNSKAISIYLTQGPFSVHELPPLLF